MQVTVGKYYIDIELSSRRYVVPFNWLGWKNRLWGYQYIWFDGPHCSFGFGLFNIGWSL